MLFLRLYSWGVVRILRAISCQRIIMAEYKKTILILATILFCGIFVSALAATSASAQEQEEEQQQELDLMPPQAMAEENVVLLPTEETHPVLRLTPDKSEIIRLDRDAAAIIVGNPAHLSILMDSPKLLIAVPAQPGATHFTVLDFDGGIIMQRHVIVGAPKKKYVRIRRICNVTATNCSPTSIYYCPDTCHQISIMQDTVSAEGAPAIASQQQQELSDSDKDLALGYLLGQGVGQ